MFALGARLMIRLRLRHHRALFFFNDTATTEIYTLSLHDALPISWKCLGRIPRDLAGRHCGLRDYRDRKSTRLNFSHGYISYAVFCLKKKKHKLPTRTPPQPATATSAPRPDARPPRWGGAPRRVWA